MGFTIWVRFQKISGSGFIHIFLHCIESRDANLFKPKQIEIIEKNEYIRYSKNIIQKILNNRYWSYEL